jgi:tetratricopeptide (TPR) repeat protein
MANAKRNRLRSLVIVSIVLLLLAGLGAGFNFVYERGLKREGLCERAQRAASEGRNEDALALAREALASEPGRDAAREVILHSLLATERTEEAKAEARRYLDENPNRLFAAVRLCQLALRDGNTEEAERLAMTFADRDPAYAYNVVAIVRDHRGLVANDPRQRLDAAALMRGFASLAETDAARVDAILYSVELTRELISGLPHGELSAQRAQADLKEAGAAVNAAVQANKSYPYEVTMGRIRILSDDPEEAALGAKMLRPHTSGVLKQDLALLAITRYHIDRGEWTEATELARRIEDPYIWLRLCWTVRRSDQPDQAAALLDGGPLAANPATAMLRAELMIRSADPARKAEGIASLGAMIEDPASATPIVARALIVLATGGGVDAALASAERAKIEDRHEPRLTAIVAALLSARGSERGLELAEQLAGETSEPAASRDLMGLLGGGSQAFDRYVDTQVGKGGESELQYRLYRALGLLARAKALKDDQAGAQELRQRARTDLDALRASTRATKPELVIGFQLATTLGEPEMAGELLARAVALPGEPRLLDVRALAFARELKDAQVLGRLASGIRGAAPGLPARAFLEILADVMATPDIEDAQPILQRLDEAAKDPGSRQSSLELACAIAGSEGDLAAAERLARAALSGDPLSPVAIDILGATMVRRGAMEDVLAFYAGIPADARPEAAYGHIAQAQFSRGKKQEALATAREAVRRFPRSASCCLLLAQLYRDLGEPKKALSVLSLAAAQPLLVHMRAELLREVGDLLMAERLYQALLSSSRFSDLVAWRGLMETLTALKRSKEFVVLAGRALESGVLREDPKAMSAVRNMRGHSLEADGKIEESLADYEEAIRLDGTNAGALNNAAWHIARIAEARIAEARVYIDRAMNIDPDAPAFLDTAAEVYSVQQDPGALDLMERALKLASEGRRPFYTVHKAEILLRGQREEEAKALLQAVRKDQGDHPAAQRARTILWEIERKHLPEEEPEKLPAVPEDEDERPENGGGE